MGKHFNYALLALAAFSCASAVCANHKNAPVNVSAEAATNIVEFNGSRAVVDSQYTYGGKTYWMTANDSSGIKFDTSNKLIHFLAGGYMQNLTAMNGIIKIKLTITKGSIRIFKEWKQPCGLETCMYDTEVVYGTGVHEISFTDKPNYFRLLAEEESSISNITITRDNSTIIDSGSETLERGLENSFIDCGSLNQYANVAFTTDTCERSSGRALKITFKNTRNDYFVINPERDYDAKNTSSLMDLSRSTLVLKAKFKTPIADKRIQVKAIAKGWDDTSKRADMTPIGAAENGWQTYKLNFNDVRFNNSDKILRLNFYFPGIDSTSRKNNGVVLLDNIQLKINSALSEKRGAETLDQGLENSNVNESQFIYSLTSSEVFGYNSETSMFLKPNIEQYPNRKNWLFALKTDGNADYWRFNEGVLSFDYKPVNFKNKTDVSLALYTSSNVPPYKTTVKGVETTDGWYRASLNLKQTGFETIDTVSCEFSFNITSVEAPDASVYLDNVKISEDSLESFTEGWENMTRDESWEKCDAIYDTVNTHSDTSINSLQLSFKDKNIGGYTRACTVLSPEEQKVVLPGLTNNNTLSAHFMFSDNITDHTIRFFYQDSNWNGAYYNLTPTSEGNGWWQIEINKKTLPAPIYYNNGVKDYDFKRIGFGFPGITNENKSTARIWVDDVMWTGVAVKPLYSCSEGIAYNPSNSTNARKNISLSSKDIISEAKPLSFNGAKNSVEGAELVFKANQNLRINFLPGRLTNKDGSGYVIQPNAFEVLFAKYVSNEGSRFNNEGDAVKDYYPDALVPMDRIIKADENKVSSGTTQLLWINVNIPEYIKSGTYRGYGTLIVGKNAYKVPMSVKVNRYTLSDENHSKSCFVLEEDQLSHAEGTEYTGKYKSLLINSYYNFLVDHRINPDNHTTYCIDNEDFGELIYEHVALNPKVNTYRIPISINNVNQEGIFEKYINSLTNKQKELCDKKIDINLFDKVLLYIIDEIFESEFESNKFDYIYNAYTSAVNKNIKVLKDYPKYQIALSEMEFLITINADYNEQNNKKYLRTHFNTACPQFSYVDEVDKRNMYFNTYDKVWFYGCEYPNSPYPSLEVDAPSYSERVASVMQYYYGFEGELYWSVNHEQEGDGKFNIKSEKEYDLDVWNGKSNESIGDGRLLYPGHKYNICGPITTLRLEQLRLARQDYEYLYDIDHNLYSYNNVYEPDCTSVKQILDKIYSNNMFDGTKISSNWNEDKMTEYHDWLLQILENIH